MSPGINARAANPQPKVRNLDKGMWKRLARTHGNVVTRIMRDMYNIVCFNMSLASIQNLPFSYGELNVKEEEFDEIFERFIVKCCPVSPEKARCILLPLKWHIIHNSEQISVHYLLDYERRQNQTKPVAVSRNTEPKPTAWTVTKRPRLKEDSKCVVPTFERTGNVLMDLFEESGDAINNSDNTLVCNLLSCNSEEIIDAKVGELQNSTSKNVISKLNQEDTKGNVNIAARYGYQDWSAHRFDNNTDIASNQDSCEWDSRLHPVQKKPKHSSTCSKMTPRQRLLMSQFLHRINVSQKLALQMYPRKVQMNTRISQCRKNKALRRVLAYPKVNSGEDFVSPREHSSCFFVNHSPDSFNSQVLKLSV